MNMPTVVLSQSTLIAELSQEMVATIAVVVESIHDRDEFRLSDESGQVLVYIGPNHMPVTAGDQVEVSGCEDTREAMAFYASEIFLPDGRRIILSLTYN